MLFDEQADPDKMIDLANNPAYAGAVNEMIEKLKEQQKIMDDPPDLHPYFTDLFWKNSLNFILIYKPNLVILYVVSEYSRTSSNFSDTLMVVHKMSSAKGAFIPAFT